MVCRELGLKGGRQALRHYRDETILTPTIWLDKFRCTGDEESLDECYLSVKEGNCRTGAAFVCCDGEVVCLHASVCMYV